MTAVYLIVAAVCGELAGWWLRGLFDRWRARRRAGRLWKVAEAKLEARRAQAVRERAAVADEAFRQDCAAAAERVIPSHHRDTEGTEKN